jgi:hypothetical protein
MSLLSRIVGAHSLLTQKEGSTEGDIIAKNGK